MTLGLIRGAEACSKRRPFTIPPSQDLDGVTLDIAPQSIPKGHPIRKNAVARSRRERVGADREGIVRDRSRGITWRDSRRDVCGVTTNDAPPDKADVNVTDKKCRARLKIHCSVDFLLTRVKRNRNPPIIRPRHIGMIARDSRTLSGFSRSTSFAS